MTTLQYDNKAKWDSPSRFVNANPVSVVAGEHQGKYIVPIDFLAPYVVEGSFENESLRSSLEILPIYDLSPEDILGVAVTPPPPPPPYSFPIGSLGYHVSNQIESRLPGKQQSIFSTQNHITPSYVRNTNCWAYDINLTGVSPWNSNLGHQGGGVLVTARHMMATGHFVISDNSTVRFITQDNQIITRTIVKRVSIDGYNHIPDLAVYVLDEDLPSSISPLRILPNNYNEYLDHIYQGRPASLIIDQEEKANVADLIWLSHISLFGTPSLIERFSFYENLIPGDSGSPAFLIINGEAVFISSDTAAGAGLGSFVTYYQSTINEMIQQVDQLAGVNTGYALSVVDLSEFPKV